MIRPSSAASSFESDQGRVFVDDEPVHSVERASSAKSDRPHSEVRVHKSYDSNSSARQRRRDSRMQSSIEASAPSSHQEASSGISRSTSQESVTVEVEKKKEGYDDDSPVCFVNRSIFREKEINDFLFLLTATLRKAPASSILAEHADFDRRESTNGSNDSDRTVVPNEHDPSKSYDSSETFVHIGMMESNTCFLSRNE